jgi:hypothetical protein
VCSPHEARQWCARDRRRSSTTPNSPLYCERGAVEREFGRLKHEWALLPLRVRRVERVRLHANLSILTKVAVRLDKERAAKETHGLPSAA